MARRSEILQAAGQLFSTQGFHATSMRDLAKAVNLQGGSLYAHIESKEALLFELVNRAADDFFKTAQKVPTQLEPKKRLTGLVRGHLEVMLHELENATVFFHEWKFLSPELARQITTRRDEYESVFRQTIQAGIASGDFEVSDVGLATRFILSALNGTYHWYNPSGKLGLEGLSKHYCTLIFQTLKAR